MKGNEALPIDGIQHETYTAGGVFSFKMRGRDYKIPYMADADAKKVVRAIFREMSRAMTEAGIPATPPEPAPAGLSPDWIVKPPTWPAYPASDARVLGPRVNRLHFSYSILPDKCEAEVEWMIDGVTYERKINANEYECIAIENALEPLVMVQYHKWKNKVAEAAEERSAARADGNDSPSESVAAPPLPEYRARICGDKCSPIANDGKCAAICVRTLHWRIEMLERAAMELAEAAGDTDMDDDRLAGRRYAIRQAAADAMAVARGQDPKPLTKDD